MPDFKISNNEQYNPYSSPVYTDGVLSNIKNGLINKLEALLGEADFLDDKDLIDHLEDVKELTDEIDLIFSARGENGYAVQTYPDSPNTFDTFV